MLCFNNTFKDHYLHTLNYCLDLNYYSRNVLVAAPQGHLVNIITEGRIIVRDE